MCYVVDIFGEMFDFFYCLAKRTMVLRGSLGDVVALWLSVSLILPTSQPPHSADLP